MKWTVSFWRIAKWGEKKQGIKYRAQNLFGIWRLAEWIESISGQEEHVQGHRN